VRSPARLLLAFALTGALITAVPSGVATASSTVRVKVMSFNIFYGGDEANVDHNRPHWCYRPTGCPQTLELVAHAIRASGADIVGLQEGTANGPVLAQKLGWYVSNRLQVISRYPLIDPPGADGLYVYAQVGGGVVAMANVHLPSDPYGPYLVRDGGTLDQVLELERTVRLPAVQRNAQELPGLADAGIPVFMTGDFNSPSFLDWTDEVAATRLDVPYAVVWPVSKALADAGLRDSYREVYPDPVARPGFTWTPPGTLESDPREVNDRIDWVLTDGPARTIDSQIVGEAGGPDVDIQRDPYPSDHRGVVSTFEVTPAVPPVFAAVRERRVFVGEDLAVTFHGVGDAGERIAVVPAGEGPDAAIASASTAGSTDGTLTFPTTGWTPRALDALLVSPNGGVRSRSHAWLYAAGTQPSVWTSKAVYKVGEPITVSWSAAPGYKWDWLAPFRAGKAPAPLVEECTGGYCGNLHYLLYEYTEASIEGSTTFDSASSIGYTSWPLGPGRYRIRMLLDDGYRLLATSARFKIQK
jgi:hypothetical protein